MSKTLLVRADSGPRAGSGHLMRSIALAQAWQDAGGKVAFVVNRGTGPHERLISESIQVFEAEGEPGSDEDASATSERARAAGTDWVVVDGYCFLDAYQRTLKDRGSRVLAIDDTGLAGRYCADIVLNQNPHADPPLYSNREPYTELLLGSDYVLLRREFLKWLQWQRSFPAAARRILITMGGGSAGRNCLIALEALAQLREPDLEVVIAIGKDNEHAASIDEAVSRSPLRVQVRRAAADMPSLMTWADFAIANAGSTAWELCFLRLPSALVVLADNQAPVAESLVRSGACISLGAKGQLAANEIAGRIGPVLESAEARTRMAAAASEFIDGQGAQRVVRFLTGAPLMLRRAREADRELLWRWANDPQTRANSFTTSPIPWEDHVEWFRRTLGNRRAFQYIGCDRAGAPVGQVRLDVGDGGIAKVSISVDPARRGRGYGPLLLKALLDDGAWRPLSREVRGLVKRENQASLRAFEKAGFVRLGEKALGTDRAVEFAHRVDA